MTSNRDRVNLRPDGRWEGRFQVAGKRRAVYARTKAECERKLRAAMVAADTGVAPLDLKLTVGEWLDVWLATRVRPNRRQTTILSYEYVVEKHIKPAIGSIPLARLDRSHVAALLATLRDAKKPNGQPISSTTQRYVLSVLRIALGEAVKSEKVARNVATLVEAPEKAAPPLSPLTANDARAFLAATATDRHGALYALAIATGMRQGELLALRWSEVDMEHGTVRVVATLGRVSHKPEPTKTERSQRQLALPSYAWTALREHRVRQLEQRLAAGPRWEDGDYVFATATGTPLESRNVTKALQAALEAAGLPRQRFHDLRHAFATLMIEDGEELAVVSKALGHANFSTTADIYAHFTPAMRDRTAARMDAILARQSG